MMGPLCDHPEPNHRLKSTWLYVRTKKRSVSLKSSQLRFERLKDNLDILHRLMHLLPVLTRALHVGQTLDEIPTLIAEGCTGYHEI